MGEGEVAAGQQGVDEPSPMPYGSSASGTKGRTAILNHRVSSQACWIRRSLPRSTMIIAPCRHDDAGEEATASRAAAVSPGPDRVGIVNKGPAGAVVGVRRPSRAACAPRVRTRDRSDCPKALVRSLDPLRIRLVPPPDCTCLGTRMTRCDKWAATCHVTTRFGGLALRCPRDPTRLLSATNDHGTGRAWLANRGW